VVRDQDIGFRLVGWGRTAENGLAKSFTMRVFQFLTLLLDGVYFVHTDTKQYGLDELSDVLLALEYKIRDE
jgi:hypothetical protein